MNDNKAKAIEMLKEGIEPNEVAKSLSFNAATVRTWKSRLAPDETAVTELKRQRQERETAETELKRQRQERETAETELKRQLKERETAETELKRQLKERETAVTGLKRQLKERETAETGLKRQLKERETAETELKQKYDKTALGIFCLSLVFINALVIIPSNWKTDWSIMLGSWIVCFLAPFVEFQYSQILIEIWDKLKDKEQRKGILKHLYAEWFAVCLLIPAMLFQSRDVYKLVVNVLHVTGWELVFPVCIAFSFQLYGLMQTLHLPKKVKTK